MQPAHRGDAGTSGADVEVPTRTASPNGAGDVSGSVVALTALSVLVGMQLIRVLFPLVGWYLRDTVGVPALGLLPYGVAPFVLSLAAPLVMRLLSGRVALTVLAVGLVGTRGVEQTMSSPRVDLWVSLAGVTLLLWLLVLLVGLAGREFAAGLFTGLAVDAAIKGLADTLDLSWTRGAAPVAFVGALTVVQLVVVRAVLRTVPSGRSRGRLDMAMPEGLEALGLVAVGPIVFLELLMLANQGWVATVTGWGWAPALLVVLAGLLVAVAAAAIEMPARHEAWVPLVAGLAPVPVALVFDGPGAGFVVALLLAQAAAGYLLGAASGPARRPEAGVDRVHRSRRRVWPAGVALGVGNMLLVAAAFTYYITYDIRLGVTQPQVVVTAAIVVAVCGLVVAAGRRPGPTASGWRWPASPAAGLAVWATGGLLVAPLVLVLVLVATGGPAAPPAGGSEDAPANGSEPDDPVRVMTYNLHSGFGTDGTQDLEAIAESIERSGAQIVAVQEISRGWLLNGSTDMVGWLQRRLGMYVAFHATTRDPLWGNAIFSTRPITATERGLLPELDTTIRRGYLEATIDLGADERIRVIDTHLHHTGDLATIHQAQVAAILDAWDGREATVLLGDMNARPGWPEIVQITTAGFVDTWQEAGTGPGLTANAVDPEHRIDWIFHTPDLVAPNAEVIRSQASDHFGVVATISLADDDTAGSS